MTMPAGLFKAKCLKLMNEVELYRKEIIITKFGKPVAKLVPVEKTDRPASPFGFLKNSVVIKGDLIAATGAEWAADE